MIASMFILLIRFLILASSENNVDQAGGERGRRRTREENNINNNMDTNRKSRWAHRQMSPGHLALDKSSRRATQP